MFACSNSGLTSAPRWPQTVQTKRSSMSDSRTLSGHKAGYIVTEWPHLESPQWTMTREAPDAHFAEGDFLLPWHRELNF